MRARIVFLLVVGGLGACKEDTIEPPAELVEFVPSVTINEVWREKVGHGTERLRLGLVPATDGTHVFAGALDGTAAAFDAADGAVLWEIDTDLPLSAGPGVGNGLVVFGTSTGMLVALDAETGELEWSQRTDSEVLAPPAVGSGAVAFRTVDGRLNAVSATTGEDEWTFLQSMPPLTLRGNSAPLIVNNIVVCGFDNGRIGAYDIATGVERWPRVLATATGTSEIQRLVDVGVDLAVFDNIVYAASFQGTAAAIEINSGLELWERELSSFTGIGVDSVNVYVTDDVSSIIALRRLDGTEVWRQQALRLRDVTSPVRYRDAIVVGDYNGYVHWLSAGDGSFLARERVSSSQITAKPLPVGQLVVVQSEDGTLVAFEIATEESE
jgi:outer membrane protein assembly factor BamB